MWDDFEIVTLGQAKAHLRLPSSTEQDSDLTLKLAQAHALVLDYVARPADAEWTATMDTWSGSPSQAPRAVQAAVLRQFGDLVRFRGDDDGPDEARVNGNEPSPRVKQLLWRYRMPVLS